FMLIVTISFFFFFFQAEDGIRDLIVTGVQTCALPISSIKSTILPSLETISLRKAFNRSSNSPRYLAPAIMELRSIATRRLFFSRSEEHTSELQSRSDLVCRLLLEKKKKKE